MDLLEVERLSASYTATGPPAVREVSFSVGAGRIVAVAGASGCGKTTILQAASGIIPHLIRPARLGGRVYLDGERVDTQDASHVFSRLGVVSQRIDEQQWDLTVEDQIAFPLENRGIEREKIVRRIEHLVERLRLHDLVGRQTKHLSGGEKRIVALASALSPEPKLLVLDEPSAGLDPGARERLRTVLGDLASAGQTVLIGEQDLSWLEGLLDEIVLLTPDGSRAGVIEGDALTYEKSRLKDAGLCLPNASASTGWVTYGSEVRPAGGTSVLDVTGLGCDRPGARTRRRPRQGNEDTRILKGLDLQIDAGEIVALVGPNGSGKTTLFRTLLGLQRRSEGSVRLCGDDDAKMSVAQRAQTIGYVSQNPTHMFFSETVRHELRFSLEIAGHGDNKELLENISERYGLTERLDSSTFSLSLRQLQYLALACVDAARPKILLFDEPLIGHDERWRTRLAHFLEEWEMEGRAAILATHDLLFAHDVADRVDILCDGRVAFSGTATDAWSSGAFQSLGWPSPIIEADAAKRRDRSGR